MVLDLFRIKCSALASAMHSSTTTFGNSVLVTVVIWVDNI